jgi:hypothetical protein
MTYRVFRRAWWADEACTVPVERLSAGYTIAKVSSEDEARALCREFNVGPDGQRVQRPFGVAYEYERL